MRDRRPPETEVSPVCQEKITVGKRSGVLVDRERLAGERRFLDLEAGALDEANVGREHVPRLQEEEVPWHELTGGDLGGAPIPDHARGREGEPLQ